MRSGELTCLSAGAYDQSMLSPTDMVVDNHVYHDVLKHWSTELTMILYINI